MTVSGIDHVNIRTLDIAASAAFYVDVLGFDYRPGPVVMGVQAHWLFDGSGHPTIHLREREADGTGGGSLDHIALTCDDKAGLLNRLEARSIAYRTLQATPDLTQIFFLDPHGITLELQFLETDKA